MDHIVMNDFKVKCVQTFVSVLLTATLLDMNQAQVHLFSFPRLWSLKAEMPFWLRTASSAGILFDLNQTNLTGDLLPHHKCLAFLQAQSELSNLQPPDC